MSPHSRAPVNWVAVTGTSIAFNFHMPNYRSFDVVRNRIGFTLLLGCEYPIIPAYGLPIFLANHLPDFLRWRILPKPLALDT